MFTGRLGIFVLVLLTPLSLFAQTNDVESRVRTYFADTPIMIAIAKCESEFTQFGKGGMALNGGMGGKMIGVFQVYSDVHADFALANGMDIYTLEGNLAYARYLYQNEGTRPWLSSFPCWNKEAISAELASTSISTETSPLRINLSMGMEHESVRTLQQILNGAGFIIAESGPGSVGNETIKFGALTRAAVRKFQCEKLSVCDGDEYTTGYGFVGSRTRTALMSAPQAVTTPSSPVTPVTSLETERDAEIARLQAQIAELTKVLAALIARR